mgnify:CR=1 FL=1
MKKENMYVPSGLKTRDGKDIKRKTIGFIKIKISTDLI